MSTTVYRVVLCFVEMDTVKAVINVKVQMNFYACLPHVMSSLGDIWCDATENLWVSWQLEKGANFIMGLN